MVIRRLPVALLIFIGQAVAAPEQQPDYRWSAGPAMPFAVQEIYPAVLDDAIFVAGGLAQGNKQLDVSDQVTVFKDGRWQSTVPLPEPRHHAMLVPFASDLWLLGGFVESERGQWTNNEAVLVLNQTTGQWQSKTPMPQPIAETTAVVIDDKIHVIGGRSPKSEQNGLWHDHKDSDWHGVYDPDADIWNTAASMPTPRNSACAVTYQQEVHVIGGRQVEGGNLNVHEIYNADTDSWRTGEPLPQERAGLACVLYRHSIFVFGGEHFIDGGDVFTEVWRYDLQKHNWHEVSVMPLPRHGLGAVTYQGKIWLIGGASEAGSRKTTKVVSQFTSMK